jgi:hypothetical protein
MRVRGTKLKAAYTQTFALPRPDGTALALVMQPLSLGFQRRLRERGIVAPSSPTRVARDAGGRPIRDETGLAVTVADESDATYQAAVELYHQRVAVLAVIEALGVDPNVEFEAQPPAGDTGWERYADAVHAELEQAGFTAGDLIQMCSFACRLSNLTGDHLRGAESNFSLGGVPDTT